MMKDDTRAVAMAVPSSGTVTENTLENPEAKIAKVSSNWRPAWVVRKAAIPLLFLAVWEGVTQAELIDPLFLPSVSSIIEALWRMMISGDLTWNLGASLQRVAVGYLMAAVSGVSIGLIYGWFRPVQEYVEWFFELFRPVPPITLIPLTILWMGIGDISKISLIAYACFWPIFMNTVLGVQNISPTLINAARVLELRGLTLFRKLVFPGALPSIFGGLKISLAISLIVIVSSEMIAANNGIGHLIIEAERTFQTARMFGGIIAISFTGLVLNWVIIGIERRVLNYR